LAKMRLCSKCGTALEEKKDLGYCCPKGHGCWVNGIESVQVNHYNTEAGKGGHSKGGKKGRKRKKPVKITPWWMGNSCDT